MPTRELLPGVTTASCPPAVVCDAHSEIKKARRRAFFRDAAQLVLLAGVDYLFVHWPESRLPFLNRAESLIALRGVNVLIIADVWITRSMPRWSARRIASTWCRTERDKFSR
jgi:hypothetical protein